MGKTLQFRCPVCLKLLVKWEEGESHCVFQAIGFETKQTGDTLIGTCPKCKTYLEFTKKGLKKVELISV